MRWPASRPGRPGKTAAEVALEDALAEVARLRETITEQAIELHLVREKTLGTDRRGPATRGC